MSGRTVIEMNRGGASGEQDVGEPICTTCGRPMNERAAAAMALELTNELRTLQGALRTRNIIGQAQGLLIAKYGLGADEAFDLLVRMSQRSGTRVADLAASVVEAYVQAQQWRPRD